MTGSHIDSVPQGGNYDGDVGVLGAIEVAELLRTASPRDIRSSSSSSPTKKAGSSAARRWPAASVRNARRREPQRAHDSRRDPRQGGDPSRLAEARRAPGTIAAFVELHIEQGAILDEAGIDIGVVEGIVGIRWWDVTVEGRPTTRAPRR